MALSSVNPLSRSSSVLGLAMLLFYLISLELDLPRSHERDLLARFTVGNYVLEPRYCTNGSIIVEASDRGYRFMLYKEIRKG